MYNFKCKKIDEYYRANAIKRFVFWCENNTHQVSRCDGTYSLYWKCKWVEAADNHIFKYGEEWQWKYERVKRLMRKIGKELDMRGWR